MPHLRPDPPSTAHEDKLYIVTRADLSSGYQTTQAVHAATTFTLTRPGPAAKWHSTSDSVVVLAAVDEPALIDLVERATSRGIDTTAFREPDLGDELTAVAFTPGPDTRRLLANLPLAGRRLTGNDTALARESRLRDLSNRMRSCDQVPGVQNVLAHGASVREHYLALLDHLAGRVDLSGEPNWRLPGWVDEHAKQLLAAVPPRWVMERYLTLHDCGKPEVLAVDGEGRRHFPGHADASARTFLDVVTDDGRIEPTADQVTIAQLIAADMDAHLLKADGVQQFAASPLAAGQLLAALAEVTSNAAMFGGVDSVSFKIKWKQLDKRGRAVCRALFGDPSPLEAGGAADATLAHSGVREVARRAD